MLARWATQATSHSPSCASAPAFSSRRLFLCLAQPAAAQRTGRLDRGFQQRARRREPSAGRRSSGSSRFAVELILPLFLNRPLSRAVSEYSFLRERRHFMQRLEPGPRECARRFCWRAEAGGVKADAPAAAAAAAAAPAPAFCRPPACGSTFCTRRRRMECCASCSGGRCSVAAAAAARPRSPSPTVRLESRSPIQSLCRPRGRLRLAAGRLPLAAGCWLLAAWLAAGCWPLGLPLAACGWLLAACRLRLAAGRLPLAAGCWPLAACGWLLAAGRLACRLPLAAGCWPLGLPLAA
eukprot:SAG11_NODE_5236_length_1620_cov_4.692965_2_plen_294_part_01